MVSTMRDREVFLLSPGDRVNSPEPAQPKSQGCILIVEDDAPTLRLERVLLEEQGYSVEVVASGEEAIEAVPASNPALVLLDIGLPGMDGFTTCQRIRELSRVPVIMVTGRDCLDDKVKGMNVGADDYVTKPFLTHELATRVKVVLRRTALENAAREYLDNAGLGSFQTSPPAPQESHSDTDNGEGGAHPKPVSPLVSPDTTYQSTPVTGEELAVPPVPAQAEQASEEEAAPGPGPEFENGPAIESEPAPAQQTSEEAVQDTGLEIENGLAIPQQPAAPSAALDTVYEGMVRLSVTTLGPVSNLINFVSELRQNPHYRLLRLVANQHKEGMDIWLGLREPVPLLSSLLEVKGVTEVAPSDEGSPEGDDPMLKVLLK